MNDESGAVSQVGVLEAPTAPEDASLPPEDLPGRDLSGWDLSGWDLTKDQFKDLLPVHLAGDDPHRHRAAGQDR